MQPSSELHTRIRTLLERDRVVLFMKGTRQAPRCGFSAAVVETLAGYGVDFQDIDVLADPDLREGIKAFSDWPTLPQLYVGAEFVGGADIVRELDSSDELVGVLGVERPVPTVHASAACLAAFRAAPRQPGDILRLEISAGFDYALGVGSREPADVVASLADDLPLHLDPASARRADGLSLDFRDGADGGVVIDNPNEPSRAPAAAQVKQVTVQELAELLASGAELRLYDVRSPMERRIADFPAAQLFGRAAAEELADLDRETPLVFLCHYGIRSQGVAEHFLAEGFRDVSNVIGGVEAWSLQVDPTLPRY